METNRPIEADEASASLASVRESRARVAWSGYPTWYWFLSGAGLGMGTAATLVPGWWDVPVVILVAAGLIRLAHLAGRARGVCEGWVRRGMTWREALVLYGPAIVVIFATAVASKSPVWSPWLSVVAVVLVFLLFAGAGLTLSARAARR